MSADWFQRKIVRLHSGQLSFFKIECDALTDEEIETFAQIIANRFAFGEVVPVPEGGRRIGAALLKYRMSHVSRLIVDDVLTTGHSMEGAKLHETDIGVVLFARGPCPGWVHPVFRLWGTEH